MKKKWWVLFAMCLVMVMLAIDATAVNIAIPVIAHDFHASLPDMQWVINAFFIAAAMVQIIGSRLGDGYGHRKLFLITIILFIISSMGVGLSEDSLSLILFRALQGATIGMAYPTTTVLIFSVFPKEEHSFAQSFIVATMGIFLAAGAPFGGALVHTIGWRWIFYINLPVGLISLFLAWKYCAPDKDFSKEALDWRGAALLVLSLFGITLALNQVQNWGFASPFFLAALGIGIVFLYLLYRNEKGREHKIVDFSLFAIRNFGLYNLIRTIVGIVFLSFLFFFPLYLQNVAGESALTTGFLMLFLTVVMAIVSPIAGKWIDRSGQKAPTLISMILFIPASVLILFLGPQPNFILIALAFLLSGTAIAITYISTTTGAISACPERKTGAASGLFFTIAWVAVALGVVVAGTSIAMRSHEELNRQIKENHLSLSQSEYDLSSRVSRGLSPIGTIPEGAAREIAALSFVKGLHLNGAILIALSILGVLLALSIKQRKPADGH